MSVIGHRAHLGHSSYIAMIVTICAAQARVFPSQPRKRSCIIVMSDPVVSQEGVSLVQTSMQRVKVEVLQFKSRIFDISCFNFVFYNSSLKIPPNHLKQSEI